MKAGERAVAQGKNRVHLDSFGKGREGVVGFPELPEREAEEMMGGAVVEMLADRRLRLGLYGLPITFVEGDAGQAKVGLCVHWIEVDGTQIEAFCTLPVTFPQGNMSLLEEQRGAVVGLHLLGKRQRLERLLMPSFEC